jgi:hypothetical protein
LSLELNVFYSRDNYDVESRSDTFEASLAASLSGFPVELQTEFGDKRFNSAPPYFSSSYPTRAFSISDFQYLGNLWKRKPAVRPEFPEIPFIKSFAINVV